MRYIKSFHVSPKLLRSGLVVIQEHDVEFIGSKTNTIYYTVDPDKPIGVKAFYVVCGQVPYEEGGCEGDSVKLDLPKNCKLVGQLYSMRYAWNERQDPGAYYTFFLFEQL